jgi:hypothetical protein
MRKNDMTKTNIPKSNQKKIKDLFDHIGGAYELFQSTPIKYLHEFRKQRWLPLIQVCIFLLGVCVMVFSLLWVDPDDLIWVINQIPDTVFVVLFALICALCISEIIRKALLRRELQQVMINFGIPFDKENVKCFGFSFIISATLESGRKRKWFFYNHVYGEMFRVSLVEREGTTECCLVLSDPGGDLCEPIENALSSAGYNVFHERSIVEGGNANAEK